MAGLLEVSRPIGKRKLNVALGPGRYPHILANIRSAFYANTANILPVWCRWEPTGLSVATTHTTDNFEPWCPRRSRSWWQPQRARFSWPISYYQLAQTLTLQARSIVQRC